MPKRTDIDSILVIGSGPIVIGQGCEFDYSGTQAIRTLKQEGYRVVLVNSNPATIMTDPEFADCTYIEPLTAASVERILAKERPSVVLPTMGGQTALNIALELESKGVFARYDCKLIGANVEAIRMAEDRELFKSAMTEIGLASARSELAHDLQSGRAIASRIGFPLILRPSRTLGGMGGGIVASADELDEKLSRALLCSPNRQVLVEESLLGWKEFELEVMRDCRDNVVIVCAIENLDPMGVHTGDSITVAPTMTLTNKEYQILRDAAIKIVRRIGVDTGGSNVQFAVNPRDGRVVVVEMNPRVSRSSALASKATGFPIAKIAAKLAIGYTLDEIRNDITQETPACFEPALDYVVVKVPRFDFEKFPQASTELNTQMKSVGESMAIGRTFVEAFQKALCSLEMGAFGLERISSSSHDELLCKCKTPGPQRIWYVAEALRRAVSVDELSILTGIDPWFISEISRIVSAERKIEDTEITDLNKETLTELKKLGFSDRRIADLLGVAEDRIREVRWAMGVVPTYKSVDTCAAEFKAITPYFYSTYESENESVRSSKNKVLILGSGPNRIGQGIEFDYCCVHGVFAARREGYEAILVNCNPETVSTDYDVSDKLYFEPLTVESVLEIVRIEKPIGVVVQFGGQTPLKLADALSSAGVPILGTAVDSIDIAEDRERFSLLAARLKLLQPKNCCARTEAEAIVGSGKIGYPVILRPSFVLGGRGMRVVHNESELVAYLAESVRVSNARPVLIDEYLINAVEVDVDAVSDGEQVAIAGIMEHVERAGVHSGDSSFCLPPRGLSVEVLNELRAQTKQLARALKVKGLLNVQFAVTQERVYILEANPRASRTVPFTGKAYGVSWAGIATQVMLGRTLESLRVIDAPDLPYMLVKTSVFPFRKFPKVDTLLGPEMKSTGEVMGIGDGLSEAFAKAQAAAGIALPLKGTVFISCKDSVKGDAAKLAVQLQQLGFSLLATHGTAQAILASNCKVTTVAKANQAEPNIVERMRADEVQMIFNVPDSSPDAIRDSREIRVLATERDIPTYTTIESAKLAVMAIEYFQKGEFAELLSLQERYLKNAEGRSLIEVLEIEVSGQNSVRATRLPDVYDGQIE